MFKNYLKIAVRTIKRNKLYSFISILGLAIGITGATLLYLYIHNELNYDSFYKKSDRIYRLVEISENDDGKTRYFGQTAPVLGSTLEDTYPEVEEVVRLYQPRGHIDINWRGERIHERNYLMTDPGFFNVFEFEFTRGDKQSAFANPNSVVITQRKARQLFGHKNPVGEVLPVNNMDPMTITGVIENVPENSHLQFDMLISRENSAFDWSNYLNNWEVYGAYTYVLLKPGTNLSSFENKLDLFVSGIKENNPNARNFYLQPIENIYFNSSDIEFGIEQVHGNYFYIYIFSAIALFLLAIAGINYTNMATAISIRRSREIGIRKAAGAEKSQLILQFLSESVVIALTACVISYFFVELALPYFNDLTGKEFVLDGETAGSFLVLLLGMGLGLGILSGSYPAFYLALLRPIRVLKSKAGLKSGNMRLRKVLVVTQFALSIVLILGTLVIYKQLQFVQSKDLGFEKEQILVVDINHGDVRSRFDAMKQELEKVPGVQDVATSSRVPGEWKSITQVFARPVDTVFPDSLQAYFMSFDEDMLELYDLDLTGGNNFTGNKQVDSLTVLLNKAAVSALGLENPVGSFLKLSGSDDPVKVVGVLENFHYQSLHQQVAPLIVGYWANPVRVIDYFSIKLADSGLAATIDNIKQVHRQFDPETAMEYHFLDRQIDQKYQADIRAGRLFGIGGGVTIFIACMGLFGLALFSTETRIQEVGIRKVLGASIKDILLLLTSDFVKLVALAFIIAVPIGWFVMQDWLNSFAYHTEPGIGVILITGVLALLLSIVTISWQAAKAALMNPVDTLRND